LTAHAIAGGWHGPSEQRRTLRLILPGRRLAANRRGVATFLEFESRLRGGGYTHFWVLDQWRGKTIDRRNKNAWTPEQIRRFHIMPTDDAYQ
jgi:hypothetical protein